MSFEILVFEGGQPGSGTDYDAIVQSATQAALEAGTVHTTQLRPRRAPYILPAPNTSAEIEVVVMVGRAVCRAAPGLGALTVGKNFPIAAMEMKGLQNDGLFRATVFSVVRVCANA